MQHIDIQGLQVPSTKTRIKTSMAELIALNVTLQVPSTKTRIKTRFTTV